MTLQKILSSAIFMAGIMISGCSPQSVTNEKSTQFHFEINSPSFPDQDFVITDFGAINDAVTLNTEPIAQAINECNQKGGGRVIIPKGVWLTGPIELQNNVNLFIDEGAIVVFSRDFDDYPFITTYFEGKQDFRAMPLLYGNNLENIAITGKGIFDGSGEVWRPVKKMKMTDNQWGELIQSGGVLSSEGDIWWPNGYAYEASQDPDRFRSSTMSNAEREKYKPFFRPPLVQLVSCITILLEGPLFQNSPGWCIHPVMCTDLTVNSITVRNPWYAQNGDGIDVESCRNVRITNSHFDVGDDAICLKSGKDEEGRRRGIPCQYIEVDNCVVHHGHGGFVIGSEMSGGVHDVWVKNCSFTGTDVGLRFKSTRGRGGVVENIHIENIRMINIAKDAIIFNLFYAGNAPTESQDVSVSSLPVDIPEVTEETPEFRNITISKISCMGADRAVHIMGLPEMPVHNIRIEDSAFKTDNGINCLFADHLILKNLRIYTENSPTVKMWNTAGVNAEAISGNHEILFEINGPGTKDILIKAENKEEVSKMVFIGEDINAEEIKIEEI